MQRAGAPGVEVGDLLGDFSRRRILFGGRVRRSARGIQYGAAYRDRNCLRGPPRRLYSCRSGSSAVGLRGLSGRAPARRKYATKRGSRAAVCVRLCDGFYFPSVNTSGGDEVAHRSVPTRPLRSTPNPRGPIELKMRCPSRARLIPALPVGRRIAIRRSFDGTCTCHHSFLRSYLADLLRDPTLRDGDLVMTDKGFAVFKSDKSHVVSAANFVAAFPIAQRRQELARGTDGDGAREECGSVNLDPIPIHPRPCRDDANVNHRAAVAQRTVTVDDRDARLGRAPRSRLGRCSDLVMRVVQNEVLQRCVIPAKRGNPEPRHARPESGCPVSRA